LFFSLERPPAPPPKKKDSPFSFLPSLIGHGLPQRQRRPQAARGQDPGRQVAGNAPLRRFGGHARPRGPAGPHRRLRRLAERGRRGKGVGGVLPGRGEGRRVEERRKRRRAGARAASPLLFEVAEAPPKPLRPHSPERRGKARILLGGGRRGLSGRLWRSNRRCALRYGGGEYPLESQGGLALLLGGDGVGGDAQSTEFPSVRNPALFRPRAALHAGVGASAAAPGPGRGAGGPRGGRVPGPAPVRGPQSEAQEGDGGRVRGPRRRDLRRDRAGDVCSLAGGRDLRRGAGVEGHG